MAIDTRVKKRQSVDTIAEYSIHEMMAGDFRLNVPFGSIKSRLINISIAGCALDSPYLIPPRTFINVFIDSTKLTKKIGKETRRPIKAVGKITSCIMKRPGHYRLGVFFMNINREDINLIDDFINVKGS